MDLLELCGGALLLYFGAEWFVGGASALALVLKVRQLVVGLTVVAWGTSAPEIVVGVEAARTSHPEVALGNVVGSNIANLGLILGIAALVKPARVDGSLKARELPVLLSTALVVPWLLLDGVVSRLESWALLAAGVAYTWLMVRAARDEPAVVATAAADAAEMAKVAREAGAPPKRGPLLSGLIALGGLAVVLVGGRLFVDGAVGIARAVGMSDRVVGLTVVAVGTSLPELLTSVVAAARGHSDLAVGNVLGSNIFNVLLCLGAAGLAGSVGAPLSTVSVDLAALGLMSAVGVVFLRSARTLTRLEGGALVGLFVAYTAVTLVRG